MVNVKTDIKITRGLTELDIEGNKRKIRATVLHEMGLYFGNSSQRCGSDSGRMTELFYELLHSKQLSQIEQNSPRRSGYSPVYFVEYVRYKRHI